MKLIAIYDEKNYNENWPRIVRKAVRGIIIKNNKVALVRSEKEGFYKFPGGGIEKGESHLDALIREIEEETGLIAISDSIKEFGLIHEIRKSILEENEIFDQLSYYYLIDVKEEVGVQKLENYEIELGYKLEWVDIKNAYQINSEIGKKYETKFILREAHILKLLMN